MQYQSGQTLIETLVAAFVLVMGISAAVALATYSLNASASIQKQIIGTGLAREGIEAVKNMRDTNWLRGTLSTTCHNFYDNLNTAKCYPDWLNPGAGYDINPGGSAATYAVGMSASTELHWTITPTTRDYGLNFADADLNGGLYVSGDTVSNSNSGYGRKITITPDASFTPFTQSDLGPRIKVTSEVWWSDRDCIEADDVPVDGKCVIKLETYLTNWKDF